MNSKELSRQAQESQNTLWHMQQSYLLSMTSWLGTSTSCTHWPLMNHWFRYLSAECSTTNSWKPGCGDPGLGVYVSQDIHTPLDLVNVFCCPVSIDSSLITTPQYPSGEPPQYTVIPSTSDLFGSFKIQNIWLRSGQSGCLSSLARDPIWLSQRE